MFVSVYSNCATSETDGGLPYNLMGDGWNAGSCGPGFCLPFDDTCQMPNNGGAVTQENETHIKWKMTLFHKQWLGGDDIVVPQLTTDPTMYFTTFVKEGIVCGGDNGNSQTACLQQPGLCTWDDSAEEPVGGRCSARLCPPAPLKPPSRPSCCDIAPGVEGRQCDAPSTAITSVCKFNLPEQPCSKTSFLV